MDRASIRVECIKAAMTMRTPGTTPEDAIAIAEKFEAWIRAGQPAQAGPAAGPGVPAGNPKNRVR